MFDKSEEAIKNGQSRETDNILFWSLLYWLLITALLTSDYRFTDF
jgi:uncharacterized membrane protein affecting hemolysin expression